MAHARTYLMGLAVALALVGGTVAAPADAGNAVCPSLCLTGGVLSRGSSAVSAAGASNNGNGMEVRNYVFNWLAVDATGTTPVNSIRISITVAGHGGGSTFNGTGHATMTDSAGNSETVPVSGSDNGTTTSYSGGGLSLTALNLGAGVATFVRDHDWTPPGGEDCDGHDNGGGIGHIIGGGQGHDCDQG